MKSVGNAKDKSQPYFLVYKYLAEENKGPTFSPFAVFSAFMQNNPGQKEYH